MSYSFSQTEQEILINFEIPEGIKKSDLDIQIHSNWIQAGIKEKEPILCGELIYGIDEENSKWDFNEKGYLVIITLKKKESTEWMLIIKNDYQGKIDSNSEFILSIFYEDQKDYSKALQYLSSSAKKSHLISLYKLAALYIINDSNYPITPNYEMGFSLFKKAAKQNSSTALFMVFIYSIILIIIFVHLFIY
eukprot:Anaeramoba_ignava/c11897_g1_i2.p1 GENE.c11897_g1_i2~~c11897_g1_i2.p1  ORF type:complete len:192 (-),score=65.95 c11897_g1_i2:420-995(-)